MEQKSSFFDIIKRAKDILFTEVDSHLVSSVLTSASQYSDSEIIKDSTFFQDPKNYPMGGWNPKIKSVYTWWVDIALYNSSKEFLIANETYFRDMDTNLAELEYLVRT